jgi:IS5 family transposase
LEKGYTELNKQMIDQIKRRVLHDKSVPALEKVVFLFDTHTDTIVKDRRDTHYGHEGCLGNGRSGLITDCFITKGYLTGSELAIYARPLEFCLRALSPSR